MNIAIIVQISTTAITTLAGVSLITWLIYTSKPYTNKLETDKNIFIYAISEKVDNNLSTTEINTTSGSENYLCTHNNKQYECKISEVADVDSTTKHWDISKIQTNKQPQQLKKDTIKSENHIYRIEIHSNIGNWSQDNHKITVISTLDNKIYASFNPLFALNSQNTVNKFTKTNYFIVKQTAPVVSQSSAITNPAYMCSVDEKNDSSYSACQINLFSSDTTKTNLHELPFQKPTWSNTDTENNKYYLVKLNKPEHSSIKSLKIKKNDTKINLDAKIVPAIYSEKKDDNIFILYTLQKTK